MVDRRSSGGKTLSWQEEKAAFSSSSHPSPPPIDEPAASFNDDDALSFRPSSSGAKPSRTWHKTKSKTAAFAHETEHEQDTPDWYKENDFLSIQIKQTTKSKKKEQGLSKKRLTSLSAYLCNCKPGLSSSEAELRSLNPNPPDQKQVISHTGSSRSGTTLAISAGT